MSSRPAGLPDSVSFGDDFELDVRAYELRSAGAALKLKPIPMELLLFLIERRGELVTREQIVERIWGKGVFLDTDNSINAAVSRIRQVLRDDAERPRLIQTISGKGYRFIAPVETGAQPETVVVKEHLAPVLPLNPTPKSWNKRGWLVMGGVAAVLALLAVGYIVIRSRAGVAGQPKIASLAVLPLKNLSGDPTQEYLADGMTEELIGRLSRIRDLRVISRTSVMRFKDTKLPVPEIAKMLGVDAIVEGSVIREGSRIRVNAQLIRGASDDHFWSEAYDRELRDTIQLESDVAQSIAQKVEATVSAEERARVAAARHVGPEVYESYLKAEDELAKSNNRAGIEKSLAYFEETISKDPTFAPAYVGLAEAYDRLGSALIGAPPGEVRPKVMSAVRKALELDPELAEAHVLLAATLQRQWQWTEAEAEYRRALELDPNNASAHRGLAYWLLCQGRIDEALDWSRRARELDPLGVTANSHGRILFHARRYDEAVQEYQSVLALQPDNLPANVFLGMALIAKGQPAKAIPVLEKVISTSDHSIDAFGVLVMAYARAGRRADAVRLLGELKRRQQTSYVPAGAFVNAYLGLGEYEQAFAWLERAAQERSNLLEYVKVHPFFDPLRGDPRFKELVHRVGLD